jgi:HAD superfamily hydrolase (TIGR01509 family)
MGWDQGVAVRALIFDFDGVIADSEALANTVLAEHVSRLGRPTTLDEALMRYTGRRWADAMDQVAADIGAPLPAGFSEALQAATLERFRSDLRLVPGAEAFIRRFEAVPRAIASSSAMARLSLCLSVLGLEATFGDKVFSADLVARGKPYPDVFLLAADRLGVAPAGCLAIEDSPSGIRAAAAAGMTAVGLCAASHVRAGHAERLRDAGAQRLASSWAEAEAVAAGFLSRALDSKS